jgi:hypothetical protein
MSPLHSRNKVYDRQADVNEMPIAWRSTNYSFLTPVSSDWHVAISHRRSVPVPSYLISLWRLKLQMWVTMLQLPVLWPHLTPLLTAPVCQSRSSRQLCQAQPLQLDDGHFQWHLFWWNIADLPALLPTLIEISLVFSLPKNLKAYSCVFGGQQGQAHNIAIARIVSQVQGWTETCSARQANNLVPLETNIQ